MKNSFEMQKTEYLHRSLKCTRQTLLKENNMQSWISRQIFFTRVALLVLLFVFIPVMTDARTTTEDPHFHILAPSDPKPENVTLSCLLIVPNVTNPTSYVWAKDGKIIPGETRNTLTLKHVTKEDEGFYQCGDPNSSDQMANYSLSLTHSELPTPRICVVGGRGFGLLCCLPENYADGHRFLYKWYKDNKEVAVQDSKKLWFPRVGEADAGNYTCAATENPQQREAPASSPFTLTPTADDVKPGPSAQVLRAVEGGQLSLTCEASQARPGVPADGYSWSRIGQDGQRRPLAGKARTLTLGPLTREDAGHYVCQNGNHQECQDVDLASFNVVIVYLKNLTLTPNREVNEGDSVTLTCSVDSFPTARLVWIVHGQEVRHVTDNLDHYFILRAGYSDNTSYTCRASNTDMPGGEMSASTRLHVLPCKEGPPTLEGGGSLSEVTQLSGREGEDLTLSVNALGNPPPVYTWSGPALTPGQRSSSVTLPRLLPEDAGLYTVNVSNVHGSFLHTFLVTVQPPAGLPAGATAGIVSGIVAGIAAILVIAAIVCLIRRRRRGNRHPQEPDEPRPMGGESAELEEFSPGQAESGELQGQGQEEAEAEAEAEAETLV